MRKAIISSLLALGLTLILGEMASAHYPDGERLPIVHRVAPPRIFSGPAIALTYAQVINGGAAVYASPSDPSAGRAPLNWLAPGFVFVSLASPTPVVFGNQKWYQVYEGGFISAYHVLIYPASKFHGVALNDQPKQPFAWVLSDTPLSSAPGAQPTRGAPQLTRYTRVTLLDQRSVNGVMWYRVGNNQWISQYPLAIVSGSPRPAAIGLADKWIEVNLSEQTLAAYEGDQMVYATLVASGLPKWPTDPGLFHIYAKIIQDKMSGDEHSPDYYYLQDIPWIMYFDEGQALHSAYWHDGFGSPHSHGCVNLAPEDALWLFNWATPQVSPENYTFATTDNPGTWVWVHN